MNRKLKSARLHSAVWIYGIGDLPATLPSKDKIVPGFAMVTSEIGIHIYGKNEEGFIPWTNVQSVTFEQGSRMQAAQDAA